MRWHDYYIILMLCLILPTLAQIKIRPNNVVTFRGSLSDTKLVVKNMGASTVLEFTGPRKELDAGEGVFKEDSERRWIFRLSKGPLSSSSWQEMPAGYSVYVLTPFGTWITKKESLLYLVVYESYIKIVLYQGKGQFIGAVADQFTAEHKDNDTAITFTFTVPDSVAKPATRPRAKPEALPLVQGKPTQPSPVSQPSQGTEIKATVNPVPEEKTSPPSEFLVAKDSAWQTGLDILHYETQETVHVGEQLNYILKITNQKDTEVRNLQVSSFIPEQMLFVVANSTLGGKPSLAYRIQANRVIFDALPVLAPNETITYTCTLKTKQAGNIIQIMEIHVDAIQQPIRSEQTTRALP